jgi:hypothetical protein
MRISHNNDHIFTWSCLFLEKITHNTNQILLFLKSLMRMSWIPSILRNTSKTFSLNSQSPMSFIGTHNGKFHCDEVFACWMLKLLPEYRDYLILRLVLFLLPLI